MKKYLVIISIILGTALLGITYLVSTQKSSPTNPMSTNATTKGASQNTKMTKSSSKYIEYSKQALEMSEDTRRVLFFYASWCPLCRPADQSFKEKENLIPNDVTVIRVNYDDTDTDSEERELANKYAVTYQHTFVQIDSKGIEITKWNGGKIDELLANLK